MNHAGPSRITLEHPRNDAGFPIERQSRAKTQVKSDLRMHSFISNSCVSVVADVKRAREATNGSEQDGRAAKRRKATIGHETNDSAPLPMSEAIDCISKRRSRQKMSRKASCSLRLSDIESTRCLGKGGFGTVLLCRVKERQRRSGLVAIKCQPRIDGRGIPLLSERRVMNKLPFSPWLASLLDVFYDERTVYFMMEYFPLGSLKHAAGKCYGQGEDIPVQFYLSNIVLGIEFLHKFGIVHSDLKPDNILVGGDGYLVIADFGHAQARNWNSWLILGTLDYMPPEALEGRRYREWELALLTDWWSTACIAYQLLMWPKKAFLYNELVQDIRPVDADDADEGHLSLSRPRKRCPALAELLGKMFRKDPLQRMGAQGSKELKADPYFTGVDWKALANRTTNAPWIPKPYDDGVHEHPLPEQSVVPGLTIIAPDEELAFESQLFRRRDQ
ncbi:kinase-like domain-containing protein [Phellopilus nigrolimitatus]|nr:kinase-like domain-containing protein [Phellopilus nigrolimitatus]